MKQKRLLRSISIIVALLFYIIPIIISFFSKPVFYDARIYGYLMIVMIVFGILLAAIEFFASINIESSDISTCFMALGAVGLIFCSSEMFDFFKIYGVEINPLIFSNIGFISFNIFAIGTSKFYKVYHYPELKIYPLLIISAICIPLYIGLSFINLAIIAFSLFACSYFIYLVIISIETFDNNQDNSIFYYVYVINGVISSLATLYTLFYNGYLTSIDTFSAPYFFIHIMCYIFIYTYYINSTESTASKARQYQLEATKLRSQLLIEQLKPHFIFNALSTIKTKYHQNITEGDDAMTSFSNYLRGSLKLLENDLVSLEDELNNLSNYLSFINSNHIKEINLIYNIDYDEYLIPSLSLQPLIENAVKYSSIEKIEGGYLMISSFKDPNNMIHLTVQDNGVGFDIASTKLGHGLNNCFNRFKLLLNAEVLLTSSPNKGTKIEITFQELKK